MGPQLEFLDNYQERLLSLAMATAREFAQGKPVELDEARRKELTEILISFLAARNRLSAAPSSERAEGYYCLTVSPAAQTLAGEPQNSFENCTAQLRDPATGQIMGVSLLRELLPYAARAAGLGGVQAVAATVAFSVVIDTLDSANVMHEKLDSIQAGIDALRARMDAENSGKLAAAMKAADRIKKELSAPGTTEADRRDARNALNSNWEKVDDIIQQDWILLRGLIKPEEQPKKESKRFPLPTELPVSVQFPIKRRAGQMTDDSLPPFSRLIAGLVTKAHILSTLELTELRQRTSHKHEELQGEVDKVRKIHRAFRQLWAKNVESIQKYGVDVEAHFDLAEQLERLAYSLEMLRQRPDERRTFILEVGREGHVTKVAALPR